MLTNWIKRAAQACLSGPQITAAAPHAAGPDEATPQAALDVKALDNIRALQRPGAPNLLEKIIALYLEDAPKLLQAMRDAAGAGDASALQRAAHTFKSSSANLGAVQLADLCGKLEHQPAAECLADAGPGISRIETAYAHVRASLARLSGAQRP